MSVANIRNGSLVIQKFADPDEQMVLVLEWDHTDEVYVGLQLEFPENLSPSFLKKEMVKELILNDIPGFIRASRETGANLS